MDLANAGLDEAVSSVLLQHIEDAILLGHVAELDDVLKVASVDPDFPEDLRYALESLRYFRAHYGKDGMMEPKEYLQKQRAVVTENAWGAELLGKVKNMRRAQATLNRFKTV